MCKIVGVRFCRESGSSFVCEYFFSPCIDFVRPLSFRSWSGQEVGYAHILCKLPVTELPGHGNYDRLEDGVNWTVRYRGWNLRGLVGRLLSVLKKSKNKHLKVYLDFRAGKQQFKSLVSQRYYHASLAWPKETPLKANKQSKRVFLIRSTSRALLWSVGKNILFLNLSFQYDTADLKKFFLQNHHALHYWL